MYLDFNMSPREFRQQVLYQKPKIFKGAVKDLDITWNKINELYQRANPTDELFRLRKGDIIPISEYVERFDDMGRIRHRFIKPAIYHYLKQGATIVYNRINNEPFVDSLAKQISHFVQAPTVVSGYLAFGSDASFKSHWDTRDVFAVQLMGKKHWSLSKPNFDSPLYMQQSKDIDVPEPTVVDMEVVLEAGDVLYIPRGWWHNPVPLGYETFHIAVGTFAPTGYDYMKWLAKQIPNILPLRYNFSDWESDKNNIAKACDELSIMANNHSMYDRFIQEHMAGYRSDSTFNMQLFGNGNADNIPDDALIISNIIDNRTIEKGYVIANGLKININDDSQLLLKQITQYEPISLGNILKRNDKNISNEVRTAIAKMAELDIIELIL